MLPRRMDGIYDETTNSIEFFGSHIPSDGSKIKVYVEGSIPDKVCLSEGVGAEKVGSLEVSVDDVVPYPGIL